MGASVGALAYVGQIAARAIAEQAGGLQADLVALMTIAITALLSWLFLFVPQLYVPVFFCHRDCGWLNAIEASMYLARLEGKRAIGRAFMATLGAASIVGIPGAVALVLRVLDDRESLLAALLREKTVGQSLSAILIGEATAPQALREPFLMLERGRYLEALNAFQIYLYHNRADLEAHRGECHALLYLGNIRAGREKLELWKALDPTNSEPQALLDEIAAGEWSDGGSKLKEARRKQAPDARSMSGVAHPNIR